MLERRVPSSLGPRDDYTSLLRGLEVDGAVHEAGRGEQPKTGQFLEQRGGEARTLPHGADDSVGLETGCDGVLVQERLVEDIDSCAL